MIEFGPDDCEITEGVFDLADHPYAGAQVKMPEEIVTNQSEIDPIAVMQKFNTLANDCLAVTFPQLDKLPKPNPDYIYKGLSQAIDYFSFRSRPIQDFHQDGGAASGHASGFSLTSRRDFFTMGAASHDYETGLIPLGIESPKISLIEKQALIGEAIKANLIFCVNQTPGFTMISNCSAYHARGTLAPISQIDFPAQPNLHCYDLPLDLR